jgi:GNAT superfamily N-acetyltransferase
VDVKIRPAGDLRMVVCSVCDDLEIVEGSHANWRALARFHYRVGRPGTVDRVFVLRMREFKGSLIAFRLGVVGVVVYSMPLLNCAVRHRATGGRYLVGSKSEQLALLNREVRWVSRVVIHPQFRGIGLAARLVRETLDLCGGVYVEVIAAMGLVNPFFERAGMVAFVVPESVACVRMRAAMERCGIGDSLLYDPVGLAGAIDGLEERDRKWLLGEIRRFGNGFWKSFRNVEKSALGLSGFVSGHLVGGAVYY